MNDVMQNDLFGHTPAQASLFGEGEKRMSTPQTSDEPDPIVIRKRLNALLAKAKAAEVMPWNEHDAGVWQIIFPNMANWLPEHEANQLRFEFAQEMHRLRVA
jgi:hypothetical protein